ncbi:MAG: hypothetical protein HN522_01065 [Flavobacteriales bacterium]|nr:hypothetical protein [Flavobacteriales bacterium]
MDELESENIIIADITPKKTIKILTNKLSSAASLNYQYIHTVLHLFYLHFS